MLTKEAGLRKNSNPKTKGLNPDLNLELGIASIVVPTISVDNARHMAKLAKVVAKKCHSRGQSQSGSTGSKTSFKYREVNVDQKSSDDGQIDEITSKVRSMYYNDIHFNSVNTCMHIKLNTKPCNGNSLKTCFKVDTVADGNLLPLGEFFKHFPNVNMTQLAKTIDIGTKLYAHNNTEIKQLGVCELLVEYREHCKICQFYVVDFPTVIFGIHDSESLGLITVHFDCIGAETSQTSTKPDMYVNTIQSDADSDDFSIRIKCEYKDLFTGIGNMNTVIDNKLKEGDIPYVAAIQHVAHALQEPLRLELEKLVDEGILRKLKIDEKSEWLNSFIDVRKPNGSIRLCLDPTHLNRYIVQLHHNSETLDDILPKLAGAKKFSIVDSTKSFFNLSLTKRASLLMTFGTMYGRYCYLRVPMGALLSSDVYQYKVYEIFEDISQCVGIADNIVIFGYDDHDHDKTLYTVLDRAHKVGMKFNPDKCTFKRDNISFYRVTLSVDGIKPDPIEIEAIRNLPEPRSEPLLQSFLGIVNYLSRFSPNIAKMTINLRALLKKMNFYGIHNTQKTSKPL